MSNIPKIDRIIFEIISVNIYLKQFRDVIRILYHESVLFLSSCHGLN
jgi:hypothetical protein